jgi:membrane associated rhomboid family serine protease
MFIHGGLMHIVGNMMFLWVFGDNIEDRLGHVKYLLFYLLTGVVATLSHFGVAPHSQTPLVGASGAISGVMGAYLLLYPYNRIKALIIFFFITAAELPALYMLGFWFLLQLFNGFVSLGISDQVEVAFFAHIGGFVAGAVLAVFYKLLTNQPLWPTRRHPP